METLASTGLVTATAHVPALTPVGVKLITGLSWTQITDPTDLPRMEGIYLWAEAADGPIHYHGRAAGGDGLARRVGNEIRWQAEHSAQVAEYRAESGDDVSLLDSWAIEQVPLVRVAAARGLTGFFAVAQRAPWRVEGNRDAPDPQLPSSAHEWESFVGEVSRMLLGHRGLLGGGAWENKRASLADRMAQVAWLRLRQLAADGLIPAPQII